MPPRTAYKCQYVVSWIAIKYRWKLNVDSDERSSLTDDMKGCARSVIVLPAPPRATITNTPPPSTDGGESSNGAGGDSSIPLQPDLPGDQDCSDFDGPVQVLAGDPDGLDHDGDGIGCE
jgi:hypothetical protein